MRDPPIDLRHITLRNQRVHSSILNFESNGLQNRSRLEYTIRTGGTFVRPPTYLTSLTSMASEEEQTSFSAESYFATQPPPSTLDEDVARVRQFIKRHNEAGRKVVLVTVSLI